MPIAIHVYLNAKIYLGVIEQLIRVGLIGCLAIVSAVGPFKSTFAESSDDKAILNVLDARIGAQLDADFSRLVSLLHPATQRLFRDELSACFDQLVRNHSIDQIRAVTGLAAHPKDMRLSDADFFVLACQQEQFRHPNFVGDPKYLPFDVRETTFHGADRVDVTLSYSGRVHTERTEYDFTLPFVVVLQRENSRWQVLSCPLANTIADYWARDLAGTTTTSR